MSSISLKTASGGSVILAPENTASNVTLTVPSAAGSFVTANSSGNVGIGTSSPLSKFEVSGGAANTYIRINDTRASAPYVGSESGAMVFGQWGIGERLRIDSSGRLLVGTDTQFNGGVAVFNFSGRPNGVETTWNGTASIYHILVRNANGFLGGINSNGSTTTYTNLSDYRVKENVQPMVGALDTIGQLKPCTFTYKIDGKTGQGFIAHELQAVVPDAVVGEKDAVDVEGNPQYQGVDTSFLVATLTSAIQEQQALIQALTARIEVLETQ